MSVWAGVAWRDSRTLMFGSGNGCYHLGTSVFVQKGIISAVKRVELVLGKMSYNKY
jgi:hypothetical protein